MESMSSINGSDNLSGRLREENARLSASVAVLEERLKETEARYQRDLESERSHLEALMVSGGEEGGNLTCFPMPEYIKNK